MVEKMVPSADGATGEGCAEVPGTGHLRFVLRDATEAAHRRLDAGFAAHDLSRRPDYAAFLRSMRGAFVPIEAWLDQVWRDAAGARFLPTDWPARRRADALMADLAALDSAAGTSEPCGPDALPRTLTEAPAAAEAPGLLYVLEGSRLGGQVLLRQVAASSDPLVRANARFLRHGESRRLWPSFAAWLAVRPDAEHADAIRGALRAFALFEAVQGEPRDLPTPDASAPRRVSAV